MADHGGDNEWPTVEVRVSHHFGGFHVALLRELGVEEHRILSLIHRRIGRCVFPHLPQPHRLQAPRPHTHTHTQATAAAVSHWHARHT